MTAGNNEIADVLADLARVKVLFQARAVAAVLGARPPVPLARTSGEVGHG